MAAVATYLPKVHRNGMNSFPRAPRSGSQTWGPGSNQMYNQHSHYTHMSAQAVFYSHPAPMKQEYTSYSGNTGYVANNSAFDSPASSSSPDSSAQGSPRSFEARHSISSQGYDLTPSEEALSNLSSPASEDYSTNSYFPEQFSADRGIIALDSSAVLPNNLAHAPVVSVQSRDPRASPPQYSSPNRSRQGSTSFLPAVTTERNSLQQKSDDSPVSPTHRAPRGQKPARNARRGGGGGGGQQKDFYTISAPHVLEEVPYTSDNDDFEEPTMVTTLNARVQLAICKEVDEVLRACLFWWLVTYKFDIPRNARARDIETADDRDYEGFCAVVNDLTAKRWVPREAVHHERIAELNTVLAGPSEIRHMLAHPERHLKSDWRMLGLIAAAIEVCKILQYRSGHRQLFSLYKTTEDRICDAKKAERLGAAMADISISKESKPLK